jgi:hypothetical protein
MSEGKAMTAEERAFRYLQERDDGERCACRDCLSDEIAALEAVILAAEQAAADEALERAALLVDVEHDATHSPGRRATIRALADRIRGLKSRPGEGEGT